MRRELQLMIGNQELDIKSGVNADSLPGIRDIQGVSRRFNFLEHPEGTVVKVLQLSHLSGGAQVFHVQEYQVSLLEFLGIPLMAIVLLLHFLGCHFKLVSASSLMLFILVANCTANSFLTSLLRLVPM